MKQQDRSIIEQERKFLSENINQQVQVQLQKSLHVQFLNQKLHNFGKSSIHFDSGHPWLIYWSIHSLSLLNYHLDEEIKLKLIEFLKFNICQESGAFMGAPFSLPHLASTYAAVMSCVEIGTISAYELINKHKIEKFLISLQSNYNKGSFIMHKDGEEDMRTIYIVAVLINILNIQNKQLIEFCGDYIAKCQTFEGGVGGIEHSEAHGGYTFCGLAALILLNQIEKINLQKLIHWAVNRQQEIEGGFNGRTNKVVDGCYSYWVGAIFEIIDLITNGKCSFNKEMLCNNLKLQMYQLICCQYRSGGLIDKPGKIPDLYHTCYVLSGLSIMQHFGEKYEQASLNFGNNNENSILKINAIYNLLDDKLQKAKKYFMENN